MSVSIQQLMAHCSDILQPQQFSDYCPNGLQVEGCDTIHRLVTGVTASLALLERAVQSRAEAILVHHGYFWKGEAQCITGMRKKRLSLLLEKDVNLIVYHLPLDAHPVFGNNVQLANRLGIEIDEDYDGGVVYRGRISKPCTAQAFAEHIGHSLERTPLWIDGGKHSISTVAWCSGAAQSYIEQAVALGVDAFISGEISEATVHVARESGIHYFAAGHHATERYGVQALGKELACQFDIEHTFIDCDNPV